MSTDYEPGVYRKGDTARIARTAADAVDLKFRGFSRVGDEPTEDGLDYRELQRQAKEAGIPANQSKEALAEELQHVEASPTS